MDETVIKSDFLSANRILKSYPTVSERYFEEKFYTNVNQIQCKTNTNCDQTVLLHSNRICLITLSPNNDIIKYNKTIKNIDFNVNENQNRLENKVQGKWKKGGQKVSPESILCRIECEDNEMFDIKACINGTIIEINTKLIENHDLVKHKTWSDGYIAIILPFRGRHESEKESLLTTDQYKTLLNNI